MARRFTIAQLIVVIALCGVAFAAVRSPSYLWANTLYTIALVSLVIAAINACYGRGRTRAYWAGFLIAGGVYFTVYSVPGVRELVCPRLVTEPILDLIYPYVSPPPPPSSPRSPFTFTNATAGWQTGVSFIASSTPNKVIVLPPDGTTGWAAWTEPDRSAGVGYRIGSIALASPEAFRQVGHSLAILVSAILGGIYARHRFGVRQQVAESPS